MTSLELGFLYPRATDYLDNCSSLLTVFRSILSHKTKGCRTSNPRRKEQVISGKPFKLRSRVFTHTRSDYLLLLLSVCSNKHNIVLIDRSFSQNKKVAVPILHQPEASNLWNNSRSEVKSMTTSISSPSIVSGTQKPESCNVNNKSCHQCRRIKQGSVVWCTNQMEKKKCSFLYCHKCLINRYGENSEEIDGLERWICPRCRGICNCSMCMKRSGCKRKAPAISCVPDAMTEIIPDKDIGTDKELTSVVGINMASEHVGNALQFLEFCACFGKILDIKMGEPEYVLHGLLDNQAGREKISAAVQFHVHLLQLIQEERGVKPAGSLSKGKSESQWFDTLKIFLSGSQSVLKAWGFECFEKFDYDCLDSYEKLILLNILCDEVLETEKVRNWISGRSRKVAGQDKDTSLKQTTGHDTDNAVIFGCQSSNTLRTYPVYKQKSYVFWKLNASGDILCQDVGNGNELTRDVKWYTLNATEKEAIEKHISLSRTK